MSQISGKSNFQLVPTVRRYLRKATRKNREWRSFACPGYVNHYFRHSQWKLLMHLHCRKRFPARKWSHYQPKREYLTVGWQKRWTLPGEKIITRPDLQSEPVQPKRREEFTEEHSGKEKTPVKKSGASQKHALHPAFIGTLFFPSASDETNVPQESYRRFQLIPATRHSGKTNVYRLLVRQSFLATLCFALYLLTASHATVPDHNVYKVQMTPQIYAVQKQPFDIRNAGGVPIQVCPTNPKEPYKIGQANDESKKMRKPPQPVKQRSTKQFPPMTSNDADFPDTTVNEVPEALLHYSTNSCPKRDTLIHALHSAVSTVQRKMPFRTCEATTVTPKELYLSLDRSVFRYLRRKIPSQKISLYSLHSSQEKHEKEIHRNCNCHESHMFKGTRSQLCACAPFVSSD